MISHGLPIYVALEPVDMRLGAERLGGIVREKMRAEPRSRALFVFVGKRGHTMKVLTWDGTGTIVIHKKLDAIAARRPRTSSRTAVGIPGRVLGIADQHDIDSTVKSRRKTSAVNTQGQWIRGFGSANMPSGFSVHAHTCNAKNENGTPGTVSGP